MSRDIFLDGSPGLWSEGVPSPELRVLPERSTINLLVQEGYQHIPFYTEVVTDAETPITAFLKLAEGEGRFLLESVEHGEEVGRYSYIGWEQLVTVKSIGATVEVIKKEGITKYDSGDPLTLLQKELDSLKVAPIPELGKFFGGAVGMISYDYARRIEELPEINPATDFPEVYMIIPKYLAQYDHVLHKITLITLVDVTINPLEPILSARAELGKLRRNLSKKLVLEFLPGNRSERSREELECSLTSREYQERVQRIKEYILAGDAFQVVLSQRITESFQGDPFMFYRLLRTINPSPYLFFLDYGGFQLAGSSPEVMVRAEQGVVTLKPIAGTKPRGNSPVEDQRLRQELLNDEKERAEHVMLVDLGRNDLGRVCRFGSVRVEELMAVELYSHVMHIVSTISGELLSGYNGTDLIRAVFPAGTLSGAPKVRAMEIIEEQEPIRRGFYGGAVGYLGFNGNLDTCITIRTVLFEKGKAHLQVGAGIVADSVPGKEYEETMNKAGALLAALARVEG